MADIQYLNYGNLQIELLALMNSLANNVQNYVNSQSWSKKRKEKFMSAYSDLINRGIVGASNETGLWLITVNGADIDFSNKDKKDKEMYNEAAYFIQQLMASLPTRTTTTPEEDKSKLQLFDNDYFNKSFTLHLSKGIAGGGDIQIGGENDMWDYLDKRDEKTGLRGRTERAKKLAEYLKSYSDSLEEGKYNFEGTAFNNLADFKSKVGKAIEALNTDNLDDDYPALNAIGLKNPQQYFYNGSNDPFKTDGYEGTYGDYYGTYLPGLLKKKAEEEVQKKKQVAQEFENNRLYFKTHRSNFFGKDLNYLANKYQSELNLVPVLQEYVQKGFGNLTPDEISELVGAFKYGAQDPISDEELKAFRAYSPVFKNATKNQFRKFRGIEGAFFHVPSGKVYTYGGRDSLPVLTQTNDILKGYSDLDKELLSRLQALDRKLFSKYTNQDGSIDWMKAAKNGAIDISRLVAIGDDIGAAIASFVPGYGTAASAAFSAHGLLTELFADMADESVSKLDVAKNAGINALFAALGLIPGGKIPKIGKSLGKIGKMAIPLTGVIMSTASGYSLLSNPDVRKSWDKVLNMDLTDLSNKDLLNIVHVLGAGVGILQGGRGIRNAARYGGLTAKTLKNQVIKTTKGEVKINDPQLLTQLNKIGTTKGNDAANKYLNETIIGNANAGHEVLVNFNTSKLANSKLNPLRFIMSPEVKAETKIAPGSLTEAQRSRLENLRLLDEAYKNGKGLGRIIPRSIRENLPTDYDLWVGPHVTSNTSRNPQNNARPKDKPILALPNKKPLVPDSPIRRIDVSSKLNVRDFPPSYRRTKMDSFKNGVNEINLFERAYGNGQMRNTGYGDINYNNLEKSINPKELTFELPGGKKITFKVSQDDLKNVTPNKINEIRLKHAKLVLDLIKNYPAKVVGPLLKDLKKNGFLKQGGRIDRQKIQKYKEFINK